MSVLRRLNTGSWSKPPVLTGARLTLASGLSELYGSEPLGDLADFVNGTSYRADLVNPDGTPIIRISNMSNPDSDFVRTEETFGERFMADPGTLLVSWSASFKTIVWPGPTGIVNQHIFKVTPKDGNDPGYIRHAIEAAFDEMQRNVVGIGMMHLRRSDFLGHRVPRPPRDVQKQVAAYLDWVEQGASGASPPLPAALGQHAEAVSRLARIATCAEEATDLLRSTDRQLAAVLPAALNELTEQYESDLGSLDRVLIGKPRNGWSARCDNLPGGVPVLTLSAVTGWEFKSSAVKLTSMDVDRSAHYWAEDGDLLMTRSNTPDLVGHAAIVDAEGSGTIFPDLMMKVPVDESRADRRFVWYWLQSPLVRDFVKREAKGTSSTMKKISQGIVMAVPFPKHCSIDEQRRIVERLDRLTKLIGPTRQAQALATKELDALLPGLIASVGTDEDALAARHASVRTII